MTTKIDPDSFARRLAAMTVAADSITSKVAVVGDRLAYAQLTALFFVVRSHVQVCAVSQRTELGDG